MTQQTWEFEVTVQLMDAIREKRRIGRRGILANDNFTITIHLTEDKFWKDRPPEYRAFILPEEAIQLARSPEILDMIFDQIPVEDGLRGKILGALIHHETPTEIDYGEMKELIIYGIFKALHTPKLKKRFMDEYLRPEEEFDIDAVADNWDSIDEWVVPKEIMWNIRTLKGILYLSKAVENADDYADKYD